MPRLFPLSLALALSLGLAGCGKRGPLEPPPAQTEARETAKADAKTKAKEAGTGEAAQAEEPGRTKLGARKRVPITPPKRDLLIDGLLD